MAVVAVVLDQLGAALGVDEPGAVASGHFVQRRDRDVADRGPGTAARDLATLDIAYLHVIAIAAEHLYGGSAAGYTDYPALGMPRPP